MRIRTVKPEFWQNEKLSALHPESMLLAIALLNYADDEGYFNANEALIKGILFPARELSMNIHDMLTDLSAIGYVVFSDGTDGRVYGRVVNFNKHQKISRPSASKIRLLCGDERGSLIDHGGIMDRSSPDQGSGIMDQVSMDHEEKNFSGDVVPDSNVGFDDLVNRFCNWFKMPHGATLLHDLHTICPVKGYEVNDAVQAMKSGRVNANWAAFIGCVRSARNGSKPKRMNLWDQRAAELADLKLED